MLFFKPSKSTSLNKSGLNRKEKLNRIIIFNYPLRSKKLFFRYPWFAETKIFNAFIVVKDYCEKKKVITRLCSIYTKACTQLKLHTWSRKKRRIENKELLFEIFLQALEILRLYISLATSNAYVVGF